jgi:hypothetical protein
VTITTRLVALTSIFKTNIIRLDQIAYENIMLSVTNSIVILYTKHSYIYYKALLNDILILVKLRNKYSYIYNQVCVKNQTKLGQI